MKAWLFQDHRQKVKLGDKCPWSVGWVDPDGKRRSKRLGSKSNAEKFQRKTEGQLAAGTYESPSSKQWADFHAKFKAMVLDKMKPGTKMQTAIAIAHFERIIKPAKMRGITTETIDKYAGNRQMDLKQKGGPKVSPATVNKELRTLRAVIRRAHKWGYLPKLPEFQFLKEPGKLPTYVTP